MNLRWRRGLVASVEWYPAGVGWGLRRWSRRGRASWRHGWARLGVVYLIW